MTKKKNIRSKSLDRSRKVVSKPSPMEKEGGPEYMVQISDPKMLRKDLLESLREVIIFMQGYEKFRKIQEEKVALFIDLKASVKEINSLIDHKLRKYFPKGKLKPITETRFSEAEKVEVVSMDKPRSKTMPQKEFIPEPEREKSKPKSDLAELETQLNDIENQLRNIR